jgi:hypothetical protein
VRQADAAGQQSLNFDFEGFVWFVCHYWAGSFGRGLTQGVAETEAGNHFTETTGPLSSNVMLSDWRIQP